MTRRNAAKKPGAIPGVEYYTEGKGFSERTRWRVSSENMTPEAIAFIKKAQPSGEINSFEGRIIGVETQAKRILEGAGLPTDTRGFYSIPDGEPTTWEEIQRRPRPWQGGGLLDLVAARGFQERVHIEWYAAEILMDLRIVRNFIAEGNTVEAATSAAILGELVGLAIAIGYYARTGGKGGSQEKKIRPVQNWVDKTVKQYSEKKEPFFWGSIPSLEEHDKPQKIDGATILRDGETLLIGLPDGRKRELARSSFKRYITRAKKSLKK
jgi:hypothetical protein